MSSILDFSTVETTDVATDEFELKLVEDGIQTEDLVSSFTYVLPISMVEDTAMAVFIFSLGMLLNAIILRGYWKEKSATSTYFKAFAVIDMTIVGFMLIRRVLRFVWPNNINVFFLDILVTNLIGSLYNFGPMFLAMDRCLIVAFPHKFREYEGRMRVAKGGMLLFLTSTGFTLSMLYRFGDPDSTVAVLLKMLGGVATVLQIFAIVVLYAVIVVKVLTSDRKLKASRHVGST